MKLYESVRALTVPIGVDISQVQALHTYDLPREKVGSWLPRGESGELLEHGKRKRRGQSRAPGGLKISTEAQLAHVSDRKR